MFFRLRGDIVNFFLKAYPLSWHLMVLVLAAMLPLVLFSYAMVQKLSSHERAASERRLIHATREMAASIDQEIEITLRTLRALAVSEELSRRDLRGFHAELSKIKATQPLWATILLHSDQGALLLSANRSFDEHLEPSADPASIQQVLKSNQPTISKVVPGPSGSKLAKKFIFAVRVPILADERIQYVLSAVLSVEAMQSIVARSSADEWTRTIIDNDGTIAARSRRPEDFVGKASSPSFLAYLHSRHEGFEREITVDGREVYVAYHRSPSTSWTAAIAVPVDTLEAPVRNSRLLVSSVGLLLLITFGGMTLRYSQHLANSIRSASSGADALSRGDIPSVERSRVSEVEQLRKALSDSADLLQLREQERNEHLAKADNARIDAETANRAKSDFLANMSHEIRTPLGAMMGFADLLGDPELSTKERTDYLANILRNGKLLTQVISDILDLSKVESGKISIEWKRCSLPTLLTEITELFGHQARSKGIAWHVIGSDLLPEWIETDPTKLKQILINIVGNAIKFTSQGDVSLTLATIRCPDDARALQLKFLIADSGCGIAPEHVNKLFKAFSQTDESVTRKYGGTGLGLLLSRKLAQALGGDVQLLRSTVQEGSLFEVSILAPWHSGSASFDAKGPNAPLDSLRDPFLGRNGLAGLNILLVEDSPDNQVLIKKILKREGANVDIAQDGLEGVRMALKKNYAIVLMDLQMPVKSGFEAVAELRALGYQRPIIAVTAAALKEERERALHAGFDDHLTKPIDPKALVKKVAAYCRTPVPS